ncbi:GyrI-like domain-containing protein [Paenibacillus sp. MBLB4367]|uniref:GyrI-like domain-containing protein n=1 Tax=Paenibacillus sp. MBLB4367 TaxID=3384767 RepID=UPI0039083CF7
MESGIIRKPAFKLIGVSARTTNAAEAGPNGRLPALWDAFLASRISERPEVANPHFIYGLYTDYESDVNGAYTALLGMEAADDASPELPDLQGAVVPESKYMVFQSAKGPLHEVVPQAWRYIWDYFQNGAVKRAYTGDFELYDSRDFDPRHTSVQIYISVE